MIRNIRVVLRVKFHPRGEAGAAGAPTHYGHVTRCNHSPLTPLRNELLSATVHELQTLAIMFAHDEKNLQRVQKLFSSFNYFSCHSRVYCFTLDVEWAPSGDVSLGSMRSRSLKSV